MKAVVHTNAAAGAEKSSTERKGNRRLENLFLCRLLDRGRLHQVHLLECFFAAETVLVGEKLHRITHTPQDCRVEGTLRRVVKAEGKRHSLV